MKYNIPNLYIANKNRDSQDAALATRVAALELTVDGDSTATPPVPGLEETVGDLTSAVGNLDTTVNGDATTTPATPGLVDRVEALENGSLTVNELDFTATTDQYGGVSTSLTNVGNTIIAAKMIGAAGFVLYYQGGDDVWHLEAFTSIAPSVQVIANQSIRFIVKYI